MERAVIALGSLSIIFMAVFGLWRVVHHPVTPYTLTPLPTESPRFATLPAKEKSATAAASELSSTTLAQYEPVPATAPTLPAPAPSSPPATPLPMATYFEITEGCAIVADTTCFRAFSRPTTTSTERAKLRIGMVLAVKGSTTTSDGTLWHEIHFPEGLRYSERLSLPWFVEAAAGTLIETPAPHDLSTSTPTTTKRLVVDRSEQTLYAYEGEVLVNTYTISTGRELTPTPRGTFTVFRKTPSRYMQGPIPGITSKYYDLPGVPWNLYFTKQGAIVHGAYWHNSFGQPYSNGCVNVNLSQAKEIYDWAVVGMTVTVQE